MVDPILVLVPLLVLPIVLLFRFVACESFTGVDLPTTPRYRDYILATPDNPGTVKHPGVVPNKNNVIAYWSLTDGAGGTVAKDIRGSRDGEYVQGTPLPPVPGTTTESGSAAAPGTLLTNQESLIVSEPAKQDKGYYFNGGYVSVPKQPGLFTAEFTIEAWVKTDWPTNDATEHRLFTAGGRYDIPFDPVVEKKFAGWLVYAKDRKWHVLMYPRTQEVFSVAPAIPQGKRTHVALAVKHVAGTANPLDREVRLLVDGKVGAIAIVNSYEAPTGIPLIIGAGTASNDPTEAIAPRYPFLGQIQEVVLHGVALSDDEIANHVDINRSA